MKKPTLTAIFILLALNLAAVAGWHTNAPFVAWPASNHLRWVDNVGTYTNESGWTNSGYGQWTNNLVFTNLYTGDAGIGDIVIPFLTPGLTATQTALNAKDVRLYDLLIASAQRYIAGNSYYTESNVWESLAWDYYGGDVTAFENFFRNERKSMVVMKSAIANEIITMGWYWYNPAITDYVAYTIGTLCATSGVPPNFLDYTPDRGADSTTTAYGRIITNTWTIHTPLATIVTNTFIDSFSGTHEAIGTNGQTFVAVVTNTSVADGWSFLDYGPDGLKRVLQKMDTTIQTPTWGIGYGTNYTESFSSNTLLTLDGTTNASISVTQTASSAREVIQGVNGWFAHDVPETAWLPFDFSWYWNTNGFTPLCYTGQAPILAYSASYTLSMDATIGYDYQGTNAAGNFVYDLFVVDNGGHQEAVNATWTRYVPPVVTWGGPAISKEIHVYAKTNGVPVLIVSNVTAQAGSITSYWEAVSVPAIATGFGVTTNSGYGYASSYNPAETNYDPIAFPSVLYWFQGYVHLEPDPVGYVWDNPLTSSTNAGLPTYTAYRTVIKWDFD